MARQTAPPCLPGSRRGYIVAMSNASASAGDVVDQVQTTVDETIRQHPSTEYILRIGWIAKSAVYILMGALAIVIALGTRRTEAEASPQGALQHIAGTSIGRPLLAVTGTGLVLYAAWRLISVILDRSADLEGWWRKVGYLFSAIFYAVLAWTAFRHSINGSQPADSREVESLSSSLLESTLGRVALIVAGLVVIAIGAYFVKKGLAKEFLEDYDLGDASGAQRRLLESTGVVGWIARGVVTAAVGIFVTIAAARADASQARGFDQSFRELAERSWGQWLVVAAGAGLVLYGLFCLVGIRRVRLR